MKSIRSIIRWLAVATLSLLCAAAAYGELGDVMLGCPDTPIQSGGSFEAEIVIDLNDRVLGGYSFTLIFDPSIAVVTQIRGGTSAQFSAAPTANPSTFASGFVPFSAANTASTVAPTGLVSVARIGIESRGVDGELITLFAQPEILADVDGLRLPASAGACVVVALGPTRTPTATATATATVPAPTATATVTPPTAAATASVPPTPPPSGGCIGDCNGDREVTVDELLTGISIALGIRPVGDCPAFDLDGDGQVVVTDIVSAVNASLIGCPAAPTAPASATPSATSTATATATPLPNAAPLLPPTRLYVAYPGEEIRFAIGGEDPEGGSVTYTAIDIPVGASFDAQTGVLFWTPSAAQVGPHYVSFVASDNAVPAASSAGMMYFQVEPRSPCLHINCDAATGCSSTMVDIAEDCCADALPRIAYADVECPAGAVVFAGRNVNAGIGRLQQCDWLRVLNFAQTGAAVRLNFEGRCLNRQAGIRLRVRLQSRSRVVLDDDVDLSFFAGENGYIERVTVPFTVRGGGPFFDLEDAEAILSVIASDSFGTTVRSDRRVRLNFDPHPDLIDPVLPAPTPAFGL